jgi:dTDP-4-amino-4,6-dideoxygalactose transaminase
MSGCSPIQGVNYCLLVGLYSLFSHPRLYWLPQRIPFLNLGGTVFEPEFDTSWGHNLAIKLAGQMLESIERDKKVRGNNTKWYSDNLKGYQSTSIRLVPDYPYLRYPLLMDDVDLRNRILEALVAQGTGATGSYPAPLNQLPKLNDVLKDSRIYNNARKISTSIVTLPLHSGVKEADREKIVRIVRQVSHAN